MKRNTGSRYGSKQSNQTHFSGSERHNDLDMTSKELETRSILSTGPYSKIRSAESSKAPSRSRYEATQQTMSPTQSLLQLLDRAAKEFSSNGIVIYNPDCGDGYTIPLSTYKKSGNTTKITYFELQQNALQESITVQGLLQMNANKIVLLHVDSHLEGIHWFWAIVAAGGIPYL
ncbi:MAG: hypothetical protein CL912_08485 [Deltaproteobacteria bacterium]|nr:hypothetical protein [Deltaproteobacteria bacterium]